MAQQFAVVDPALQQVLGHPDHKNRLARYIEPAFTVGSAIAAEPFNIIAGLLQSGETGEDLLELFDFEPYEEPYLPSQSLRRMEEVGERLTYSPQSPEGQAGLQSLTDAMVSVMDTLGVDEAINYLNTTIVPNLQKAFGEEAAKEIGSAILMSVPMVRKVPGIRAYHGSPHDFDEFSMEQIGTGEGAQAYGHGLYFSETEDVAKGYRDQLTPRDLDYEEELGRRYKAAEENQDYTRMDMLERAMMHDEPKDFRAIAADADYDDDYRQVASEFADEIEEMNPDIGHMYQVDIDASPDELLDWDSPVKAEDFGLDVQPTTLSGSGKRGLTMVGPDGSGRNMYGIEADTDAEALSQFTGERLYHTLAKESDNLWSAQVGKINDELSAISDQMDDITIGYQQPRPGMEDTFKPLLARYNSLMAEKLNLDRNHWVTAADVLKDKGYKGIKYKDGFSRGAEGGTSNYVIFDDRLISIAKKYGIAIPAAAALLSQQTGQNPESFYQEDNSV